MISGDEAKSEPARDTHEDRVQGTRLLLAVITTLFLYGASAVLAVALVALWIYFRFGVDDLVTSWDNPILFKQNPYLSYSIALIGGALVLASYRLSRRIFFRSGYISHRTQEEFSKGRWPVIGGYWKPVGYVVYIGVLSYGAYLGYVQEGLWALLLTLSFVLWLIYLAWIDLRKFMKQRRNPDSEVH